MKHDDSTISLARQAKRGEVEGLPFYWLSFVSLPSTNGWAKQHLKDWAEEGLTVVTAAHQTAGYGRLGRIWLSPPHVNLYASFCLWREGGEEEAMHISHLLGLATACCLEEWGFTPCLKWPNDLLIKGKKVAGTLCEAVEADQRKGLVCGIGLNVNMTAEALQPLGRPATSLALEGGQFYDPFILLDALMHHFARNLSRFRREGFNPFFPLLYERRIEGG